MRPTLFWLYRDTTRQFIFASNWLEALGWLLTSAGGIPTRLACEVRPDGRVLVRDMEHDRLYVLVPEGALVEDGPELTDELPIEATSDSTIPV